MLRCRNMNAPRQVWAMPLCLLVLHAFLSRHLAVQGICSTLCGLLVPAGEPIQDSRADTAPRSVSPSSSGSISANRCCGLQFLNRKRIKLSGARAVFTHHLKIQASRNRPKIPIPWLVHTLAFGARSSYFALHRLGAVHPRCQVAPWPCKPTTSVCNMLQALLLL